MDSDIKIFIEGVVAILLIVAIVISMTLVWDKRVESRKYYRVKYLTGKFEGRISQRMNRKDAKENARIFGGVVFYDKPGTDET